MLEAGREPERHAAGGPRRCSSPQHTGLDPRGAGRGAAGRRWPSTWSSPRAGWCPARRRPAPACWPPRGGCGPDAAQFGSPTCSDWVFLRQLDAIKCGPGTSRRSHTAGRVRGPARGDRGARLLRRAGAGLPGRTVGLWRRPDDALELRPSPDQRLFEYTAGRRPPLGRAAPPLGRARQPGPHRGAAGRPAARPPREYARLRARPAEALAAVDAAGSSLDPRHEDVHTAVEDWLTRRLPGLGERLHTGRSRNDQVACDLRLYLKDRLLAAARRARWRWRRRCSPSRRGTRGALARLHPSAPGHAVVGRALGRCATPKGCWTPSSRSRALWARVDRSPLGQRGGYGVPLPLRREAAARALGLRRARPQRRHGAGGTRQARGGGALLVHPAGARARAGCRRT